MMEVVPCNKDGESAGALTVSKSQGSLQQQLSKEKIEWLREQRESHKHKTIWTKDAHGGPYKKATGGAGIDPLRQNFDGSTKSVALGHEVAEVGPTSNFVGNHMTQGAIDMVQALLQMRVKEKIVNVKTPQRIEHGDCNPCAPSPCIQDSCIATATSQNGAEKSLCIVKWDDISEKETVILLERPYAEDATCSMNLSTMFDTDSVEVQFCITSKTNKILKRYRRKIEKLPFTIAMDRCGCFLGSGTIEEMRASENIANTSIEIQHSDPSTMICILLYKDTHCTKGFTKEADVRSDNATTSLSEAQSHLKALKSLIRKSRSS